LERFASYDGVEIAYQQAGTEAEGPPVVLHHGFAADGQRNWVATGVVAALVAEGRRVVTIDARGHGQSGKPHDPAAYADGAMARDLMLLIDRLGVQSCDLVGYSLGAIVALTVAPRDPRIRRMVIGGVGGALITQGSLSTGFFSREALAEALEAADPTQIQNPSAAAFRVFADLTGADRLALAAIARSANREPLALDRISIPTLVLAGDKDPLASEPEVLAGAIGGARFKRLPGDHLGVFRDPALIPAIVDFVR
jgi:pimeloyl-ACP methyl ester carboxylesterase